MRGSVFTPAGLVRVLCAVLVALLVITVYLNLLNVGIFFAGNKGFPGKRIDNGGTLERENVDYTRSRSQRTRGGQHFSVSRVRGTLGSDVGWLVGGLCFADVGEVGCLVGKFTTLTFLFLFSRYTNGTSGTTTPTTSKGTGTASNLGVTCMRMSALLSRCGFYGSLGTSVVDGRRGDHVILGRGTGRLHGSRRRFRGGCRDGTFVSPRETRRRCTHLNGLRRSLRTLRGGLTARVTSRGTGGDRVLHSSVGTFLGRCGGAGNCGLVVDGADFSGLLCTSDALGVAGRVMSKLGTECAPITGGWGQFAVL